MNFSKEDFLANFKRDNSNLCSHLTKLLHEEDQEFENQKQQQSQCSLEEGNNFQKSKIKLNQCNFEPENTQSKSTSLSYVQSAKNTHPAELSITTAFTTETYDNSQSFLMNCGENTNNYQTSEISALNQEEQEFAALKRESDSLLQRTLSPSNLLNELRQNNTSLPCLCDSDSTNVMFQLKLEMKRRMEINLEEQKAQISVVLEEYVKFINKLIQDKSLLSKENLILREQLEQIADKYESTEEDLKGLFLIVESKSKEGETLKEEQDTKLREQDTKLREINQQLRFEKEEKQRLLKEIAVLREESDSQKKYLAYVKQNNNINDCKMSTFLSSHNEGENENLFQKDHFKRDKKNNFQKENDFNRVDKENLLNNPNVKISSAITNKMLDCDISIDLNKSIVLMIEQLQSLSELLHNDKVVVKCMQESFQLEVKQTKHLSLALQSLQNEMLLYYQQFTQLQSDYSIIYKQISSERDTAKLAIEQSYDIHKKMQQAIENKENAYKETISDKNKQINDLKKIICSFQEQLQLYILRNDTLHDLHCQALSKSIRSQQKQQQ